MLYEVTASIVLYKNDPAILKKAIESFLHSILNVKLYLIDNSPSPSLKEIIVDARCEYVFTDNNLGFGKAHNIALKESINSSKYHLILNPDVFFDKGVIEHLFYFMEKNTEVGQIMPKILYPNGEIQYSGKLLPTPFDLIGRRLFKNLAAFENRNRKYELRDTGYDRIMNVPHHLGCFMFIRTQVLLKAGIFDESIFMYTEDIDLTRRIFKLSKTLYYPESIVYHHYAKGSQKKIRLLLYHIKSAIIYFNKWGWFFDHERSKINNEVVQEVLDKN